MSPLRRRHNRLGMTRDNLDRTDLTHCAKHEDHAPHPNAIYWCPGGPYAAPGNTRLRALPDTRTAEQRAQASGS